MRDGSKEKSRLCRIRMLVRLAFVLLAILFCCLLGYIIVKFALDKDYFRDWMNKHGVIGGVTYMIMVIFQVIIAFIPGEPVEIAGGYAFGAVYGTILYLISATIGGMIVFTLVRKYGVNLVEMIFSKKDVRGLEFLRNKKGEALLIFLFVIPGTPKDLLCYFAGLTSISYRTWFVACSLGRIPSIVTSTIVGDALEKSNYLWAVVALFIAMVISVSGIIIYKNTHKKHNSD